MQLFAEIAESDVGAVRPGSKATFQVEAIGIRASRVLCRVFDYSLTSNKW